MQRAPLNRLRLVHPDRSAEAGEAAHVAEHTIVIDCAVCVARATESCDDCVVTYLVDHDESTPVVFGPREQHAVDLLADAGLVPHLRFRPRDGVA